MSTLPPSGAGRLKRRYPQIWDAYSELGKTAAEAGPLDAPTRRLIKLALAIGARGEGAVHAHVRQALAEGADPDSLRHVALLAISTLGFPAAIAGLSWVEDLIEDDSK